MTKRYAVYGAGNFVPLLKFLLDKCTIFSNSIIGGELMGGGLVAMSDTNPDLWGTKVGGVEVVAPEKLKEFELDKIFISNLSHAEDMREYLTTQIGFADSMIDSSLSELVLFPRQRFLSDFAELVALQGLSGSVAECGVFRGVFAKAINEAFPDRSLWLFDSFDSFTTILRGRVTERHRLLTNGAVLMTYHLLQ